MTSTASVLEPETRPTMSPYSTVTEEQAVAPCRAQQVRTIVHLLGEEEVTTFIEAKAANRRAIMRRIQVLGRLQPGWHDGEGEVPTNSSLRLLGNNLGLAVMHLDLPRPYLFPTPEGGIQAEWRIGPWDVTAEFDFIETLIELHALNHDTDAEHDEQIPILHGGGTWRRLTQFVRQFMEFEALDFAQ